MNIAGRITHWPRAQPNRPALAGPAAGPAAGCLVIFRDFDRRRTGWPMHSPQAVGLSREVASQYWPGTASNTLLCTFPARRVAA